MTATAKLSAEELSRALFEENLDWATAIARNVHRRVPPSFDLDDLIQEAHIALWKKSKLYDPGSGVPFRGFASLYVQGAVKMLLRRRHWLDHTSYELITVDEDEDGE